MYLLKNPSTNDKIHKTCTASCFITVTTANGAAGIIANKPCCPFYSEKIRQDGFKKVLRLPLRHNGNPGSAWPSGSSGWREPCALCLVRLGEPSRVPSAADLSGNVSCRTLQSGCTLACPLSDYKKEKVDVCKEGKSNRGYFEDMVR